MRLSALSARAHPDGNGIVLTWSNPQPLPAGYRLSIARRRRGYPASADSGDALTVDAGATSVTDTGLMGETTYYYTFFPSSDAEPETLDVANRVSATTTAPYGLGAHMYQLLPEIYRRYDAATLLHDPVIRATLKPADRDHGALRRFLDLPGGQLDQFYSLARTALRLHDVEHLDGALLPLLAQWIGWHTDYSAGLSAQRNEIRYAPWLYRCTGTAVAVAATTARLTHRPCRIKEYVHNVARTNNPERLNLWTVTRDGPAHWTSPRLLSVNAAYDGRPTVLHDTGDRVTLLYHTLRRHGADIWAKTRVGTDWSPSRPVIDRQGVDKHPTAAASGRMAWLFWQTSDAAAPGGDRGWRVAYSTRPAADADAEWTTPEIFGDPAVDRRSPAAVADDTGGVWLFWLERTATGGWVTRYNRHDGTSWQLPDPGTVGDGPSGGYDADLSACLHGDTTLPRLWISWAHRDPGGHWKLLGRSKEGLDPHTGDWSEPVELPGGPQDAHDREPALLAVPGGVEVFFSTTRGGGWSVQSARYDHATAAWGAPGAVVGGPCTNRGPAAVRIGEDTVVIYRSNDDIVADGSATPTTSDNRYGGTITVDTSATARIATRGTFEDAQTYTYDTRPGRRPGTTISARDAVGITLGATGLATDAARLAAVLTEYLPITTRAVILDDAGHP